VTSQRNAITGGGNGLNRKIGPLIRRSLEYCVKKSSSVDAREVEEKIRNNHGASNSTFRYALAKEICRQLVFDHEEIEACYLFGSSLTDAAKITSDIDLVIKVTRKSKTLENSVVQIDKRILNYYKRNMNGSAKGIRKMLDVYFVDERDIQERRGFATVIQSTHSPPIKIVERK
jgi:predicted nucleotidyltransferase